MATYIDAVGVSLRQNGDEVFMFNEPDFKIKELDGFRRQNFDVRSQEFGVIDGGSIIGSRVKTIERTVTVHFLGTVSAKDDVARDLQDSLSLTSEVTLELKYFGATYKCTGRFSRFEMSEGNLYEPLEIKFSIMCGDPYLTVGTQELEWTEASHVVENASKVATLPRFLTVAMSDVLEQTRYVRFTELDRFGNSGNAVNIVIPGGKNIRGLAFMWTYNPFLNKDVEVPTGWALQTGTTPPFSEFGISADWQTVRMGEGGLKVETSIGNFTKAAFSCPIKTKWV